VKSCPFPDGESLPTTETASEILDLRRQGEADIFVAAGGARNHIGTMFGGRLIGQSLFAAIQGVDAAMPLTSFHAYFLAPGQADRPVDYHVARLRDSRRFANRQVSAVQAGRTIFTLMCEFHAPEDSFTHQHAAMPDVPPPEEVMPLQHFVEENRAWIDPSAIRNFSGATPIELRPVAPERYFLTRSGGPRDFWFRLPSAAGIADPRRHQCLAAYGSDYWLGGVTALPHAFPTNGRELLISSLDHAMWFHRPVRCDQWLLHHTRSPGAGDGLGLAQGQIFDRDGRLIATTVQECLLRRLQPDR